MVDKSNYRVLGVSSGLGVSLYPFKDHLIGNVEERGLFHDKDNVNWKLNFGKIPLYKKKPNTLPGPNVIISSPDCGSGSILRMSRAKKFGDHKKNDSLTLVLDALTFFQPEFFLFENLDGLFKSFPEKKFRKILKNYRLVIHNDSVAKWGNSQVNRKRLIIVGIHRKLGRGYKKFFKKPDYSNRIKCCLDLYGDLRAKNDFNGNIREPMDEIISIHARRRMSNREIFNEWNGRLKGKTRWTVEGGSFSTAPGVYRNLPGDYPATARKANRQYDETGRALTPRQLARVQGVPDEFSIFIDPDKIKYWINKGRTIVTKTPPYEISVWFKKCLEKALTKKPIIC